MEVIYSDSNIGDEKTQQRSESESGVSATGENGA